MHFAKPADSKTTHAVVHHIRLASRSDHDQDVHRRAHSEEQPGLRLTCTPVSPVVVSDLPVRSYACAPTNPVCEGRCHEHHHDSSGWLGRWWDAIRGKHGPTQARELIGKTLLSLCHPGQ